MKQIDKTLKSVKPHVQRKKALPDYDSVELDASVYEAIEEERKQNNKKVKLGYETIEITGSKGQVYKISVPASYVKHIPKEWSWDARKYAVAELIALGVPIDKIPKYPESGVKSKVTIYGWLAHPEFKQHVDALTLEMGFASKRERIAGMNRVTKVLFEKLVREINEVKMTDKSLGAMLSGLSTLWKQLAQEKEEFVEQARVEQETTISGTIATASVSVEEYMKSLSDDERENMQKEFAKIADKYLTEWRGDASEGSA